MKHSLFLLAVGLLCWTGAQAATLTYSYDGSKSAADNGTALQAAINAASSGDELKVQAGTYVGNFTMKEGVNVSGGWNAGFTEQTDYATVLDANANGRVVNQAAAFSTLTVWSNLTIQNGKFTAQQTDKAGSGVYLCDKGQVKHCLIQNNLFDAASGEASGGGVYENGYTTSVLVDDCIIRGNTASHGGGVRICGVIQNSIIENNTTTINACGGVQLHYGGAMYNCIVRKNTGKDTGGVRLTGTKACTMANCLIVGNEATNTVGGLQMANDIAHKVYNNTIVGNKQTSSSNAARCGVHLNVNAAAEFVNNIVYGNIANNTVQTDQLQINGNYKTSYSAYFKNNAVALSSTFGSNTTCLTSDPGFTDVSNADVAKNDYTLLTTSDMVGGGDNSASTVVGSFDLAGNTRIVGIIDIGAYEEQTVYEDTYVRAGEDLQTKINNTAAGYTVYVQAGTYYGNFTMKNGVNVSGGWNDDFTSQTDYATILDAQESGRVVNQPGAFSTLTIWSNLTIQNGKLTAALSGNLGAGVALNLKGQVKHCLIQNNTFTYSGNCIGGGVGEDATPTSNTEVMVDNCWIRNNTASHGGGVRIRGTVQNSIIENNQTNGNSGGGVHLQAGRMVNCIVRGNTSSNDCGGVRLYGQCQLINTLVINNVATGKVGGVGVESKNSDIIGCTIVGNDQLTSNAGDNSKCGISCGATSDNGTKLANNIVWGNKHNGVVQTAQIYYISHYAAANRVYNAVAHQNTTNGIKLSMDNDADDTYIDNDSNEQTGLAPHFADPANGDYRLTWLSPVLNKGNDELTTVAADLDGNDRVVIKVDMGAYELPYYTLTIAEFEHATLMVGETPMVAGTYELPQGYSTAATIVAEEGWTIKKVTIGDAILEPQEGVYTLPALLSDATLAIEVEQDEPTALMNPQSAAGIKKVLRGGQLIILRGEEIFNAQGQVVK